MKNKNALLECDNCHKSMSPLEQSHLENGPFGERMWHCYKPRTSHTPIPWRVGDAGHTVFGPPNGNLSPKTIAYDLSKADSAFIVRAVNAYGLLLETAKQAVADTGDCSCSNHKCLFCLAQEAITKAEGK